jgi:hypothetical protein
VYFDTPYGLGLADWDIKMTTAEFDIFFKQLAVINTARNHVLCLHCHWSDLGRVAEAMTGAGYEDIHPMYVYKPQQNQKGMNFIFAVDAILIGYKPRVNALHLTFRDASPLLRHNLFFDHQVGAKWHSQETKQPVNPTQKHPEIATRLAKIFCTPGSRALVIGSGSGSDVLGILRAGVNVVSLEKDPVQFQAFKARAQLAATDATKLNNEAKMQEEQVLILHRLASRFTTLQEEDLSGVDASANKNNGDDDLVILSGNCPACGRTFTDDSSYVTCDAPACSTPPVHLSCAIQCENCENSACSTACASSHVCSAAN